MAHAERPDIDLESNSDWQRPIPLELPSVEGWKSKPIAESGEPLVPLGPFSGNEHARILTDSLYAGERENSPYPAQELDGSLLGVYVRRGVAERLELAERRLPSGLHLVVWDGYRTLELQQSLYEYYRGNLAGQHPDWDGDALDEETQRYVSLPSNDPEKPSPHNTGGSVDVDIISVPEMVEQRINEIDVAVANFGEDTSRWPEVYRLASERTALLAKHSTPLEFGADRDHGGPMSALNHFELLAQERPLTDAESEARHNRRLLYNAMRHAGFEPFQSEYWHYNARESQMGAMTAGLSVAEYGAATFSTDCEGYEGTRRGHLTGTTKLSEGRAPISKVEGSHLRAVRAGVLTSGHPRETTLPVAEKIAPPKAA